jgi:hypothetical protein
VFHFEGDTVELGAGHGDGAFDVHGSKRDECGLTLFEGFDNAVEAGYVWHRVNAPVFEVRRAITFAGVTDNRSLKKN